MGKNNEPLTRLKVRKSNELIVAKYKASLLENQVMAIALSRIEVNADNDGDYSLEARLYPGDLRRLISDPTHIYRDLKKLAKKIIGRTMFLEDGKGNFKAFAVVPNADYQDGVFTIKFNSEIKRHVFNLGKGKNYASYELAIMTNFKKSTSFRLYEVLKKDAYRIADNDDACIQVEYNICELRFMVGLANSDVPFVKDAISQSREKVDWDGLYDQLDKADKSYEDWQDLQRYVLKPAQMEMEEKSDIRFEYEGIREGRRTKRILFTIYRNTPQNTTAIDNKKALIDAGMTVNRQLEMPLDMYPELYEDFTDHNGLAVEDITLLLNKAAGDEGKVRRAIELADKQSYIKNYMGWIIAAIERNFEGVEVIEGSAETAKKVQEISEHLNTNRESIANQVWRKIKTKPEFPDFISDIKEKGFDLDQLELIFEPEELTKAFTDWKVTKDIHLG